MGANRTLRPFVKGGKKGAETNPSAISIRAARLVKLIPTCGPLDINDPQPAITVMMPDED